MRAKQARIKSYHGRPVGNKPGILPCSETAIFAAAPPEQEAARLPSGEAKIFILGLARLLGYFEPNRTARFLLPDGGPLDGVAMRRNIYHLEAHTSQPRSLLSMARLKSARPRTFRITCRCVQIAQTCLGCSGGLGPTSLPLFQGIRGAEGASAFRIVSMVSLHFGGESRMTDIHSY